MTTNRQFRIPKKFAASRFRFCLLACLLSICATGLARPADDKTLAVRIILQPTGAVVNGQASRVVGDQLEMRNATGAVIRMPLERIESVEFDLSDTLAAASESYRAGDLETALPLFRGLVGFESLAGLPGSSIGKEFLNWADTLRQLRRFPEATEVLQSVDFSENEEGQNRALLIRAFIYCDQDEVDEAAGLMETFVATDAADENFPLDRIVRARIHLARDESHLAALAVGESLASAPIESPVYPELLYLAAQAYAKMQEKVENPDLEEQGSLVDRLMGDSVDYEELVQGVRQHLSFIFPDSYWAQKDPADVDELLARASGLKLSNPQETPEEDPPAAEPEPEVVPPAKSWRSFLNPSPTPNPDQP